jgi:hypothetical protein
MVRIVLGENMEGNNHHAKFSIPVSAASLNLEILHILECGFCHTCARTSFFLCCSCSALAHGKEPVSRVLHTYSYILQSGYDGWYLHQPCCGLFF